MLLSSPPFNLECSLERQPGEINHPLIADDPARLIAAIRYLCPKGDGLPTVSQRQQGSNTDPCREVGLHHGAGRGHHIIHPLIQLHISPQAVEVELDTVVAVIRGRRHYAVTAPVGMVARSVLDPDTVRTRGRNQHVGVTQRLTKCHPFAVRNDAAGKTIVDLLAILAVVVTQTSVGTSTGITQ
ncbi:hypothetical protein D3C84_368410 [compost metagenome]